MGDFLQKIIKITNMGESLQIVALHGMGKSRFARELVAKSDKSHVFYHIDTNQIPDFSFTSFISYLRMLLGMSAGSGDLVSLSIETSKKVNDLAQTKQVTLIFDYMDDILIPENENLFRFLKVMRDGTKYKISYIFMVKAPIQPDMVGIMKDLYELASEHVEYLPLMTDREYEEQVVKNYGPNVSFVPNRKQVEEIKRLSGKIPALIKITMQAIRDGLTLSFQENHRLRGQLEEMVGSLSSEELKSLTEIAREESLDNKASPYLKKIGIVNDSGKIGSHLLADFLIRTQTNELSVGENQLFLLLKENEKKVVTKDAICEKVYPDVKNMNGISDHAIDQMVHRLRSKLGEKYKIETLRGRGYILTS
jgi:hypothetical protein